ncbi:MAG: hypothetical protein CBARDCOR_5861 [uncultured Caballeronia sp.]|nr:MAG: hypothetical protein CBARDCOR_5861 [uncultured Caballeronia sp.]
MPELDPVSGAPDYWRIIVSRPSEFVISDTWHTTGLAGSGSLDYSVKDLFLFVLKSTAFRFPNRSGRGRFIVLQMQS